MADWVPLSARTQSAAMSDLPGATIFEDGRVPTRGDVTLEELPKTQIAAALHCHSGDVIEATWRGVAVETCLDAPSVPPTVTHVLVEAADGSRACIPIVDVLVAVLAYESSRPESVLDPRTPRLVGPGIDITRLLKDVIRIWALALPSAIDPNDLEDLPY